MSGAKDTVERWFSTGRVERTPLERLRGPLGSLLGPALRSSNQRLMLGVSLLLVWVAALYANGLWIESQQTNWLSAISALATLLGLGFGLQRALPSIVFSSCAGHIVVIGDDEEAKVLAVDIARTTRNAIVLLSSAEKDPTLRNMLAEQGVLLLFGQFTEDAALRAAGVPKARHVIVMGRDDTDNVSAAATARRSLRKRRPGDLLVRVESPQLRGFLSARDLIRATEMFSLPGIATRMVLSDMTLLEEAKASKADAVHVAIIGWDRLTFELLTGVFRRMWAVPFGAPKVTIFCADSKRAEEECNALFGAPFDQAWSPKLHFVEFDPVTTHDVWSPLNAAEPSL